MFYLILMLAFSVGTLSFSPNFYNIVYCYKGDKILKKKKRNALNNETMYNKYFIKILRSGIKNEWQKWIKVKIVLD